MKASMSISSSTASLDSSFWLGSRRFALLVVDEDSSLDLGDESAMFLNVEIIGRKRSVSVSSLSSKRAYEDLPVIGCVADQYESIEPRGRR